MKFDFLKKITPTDQFEFRYSVCTLVTRLQEYEEMVSSYIAAGFDPQQCEFLYIDNSVKKTADAYHGINLFLNQAKGKYIIVCHQDVLLNQHRIEDLDERLKELDKLDSNWAICGNAGAPGPNYIVYHISYPNNVFKSKGLFPVKVTALDENFLVVKNAARISQSRDLSGFHLYATDLCLSAVSRGYSAYAIAFNLTHKSYGNRDNSFYQIKRELIKKYNRFFKSRWIQTPSAVFFLSGSRFRWLYANPVSLFIVRMINGIKKRRS